MITSGREVDLPAVAPAPALHLWLLRLLQVWRLSRAQVVGVEGEGGQHNRGRSNRGWQRKWGLLLLRRLHFYFWKLLTQVRDKTNNNTNTHLKRELGGHRFYRLHREIGGLLLDVLLVCGDAAEVK